MTANRTAKPTPAKQAPKPKPTADKPKPQNCACGCGAPTITAKAAFLSGHDARFAGLLGRGEIKPTAAQKAVLEASPRLQAKVEGIVQTQAKRLAAKQAREAAQKAAAAAKQAVLAKAGV